MAKTSKTVKGNKKTVCTVSRKEFQTSAKPLVVTIDGKEFLAVVKEFSTGSFGWYLGDKAIVMVNGVPCKVQVACNLIVIGSKEAE